ncbi:MAG: type II toxin-antitoxin system VapC family toxin [Saccharolobus sp.]|uniref:type II toxin-antitoxin system VapC family toxin n=1 Tax=Saccharolobus sp. TaxID=2100761 RepID=UPI0028CEEB3A|nr:type II toxin-antitoxin system VapC family toxin [Saccharolobus sp.]MDT7862709.1 type II toxin-antitoxin system VapC family toxin [Saccharolobus sp.]
MILDSSAIASFFFRDSFTDKVIKIIEESNEDFLTLDLAFAEVSNVAWKRIVLFNDKQNATLEQLRNALDFIEKLCKIVYVKDIAMEVINLAVREKLSFYDSAFLYLAIKEGTKLLTTDLKLFNKLNDKLKNYIIIPESKS